MATSLEAVTIEVKDASSQHVDLPTGGQKAAGTDTWHLALHTCTGTWHYTALSTWHLALGTQGLTLTSVGEVFKKVTSHKVFKQTSPGKASLPSWIPKKYIFIREKASCTLSSKKPFLKHRPYKRI